MKITTVLTYCTIDFRFLDINLRQLSKFSDEIIIPLCTKFWNGDPENEDLFQKSIDIIKSYPKCTAYTFEWDPSHQNNHWYYENLNRALGTSKASNEWILFVDGDEIVEDGFGEWFETIKYNDNSYWLTCYWYFREPIYQSIKYASAGLLIKKKYCNWNLNGNARQQLFDNKLINGDNTRILSKDGTPFVHHMSWVRTKEEMLQKVKSWGHTNDKDWTSLIEEEFKRPFNGTDFVHGHTYKTVENKFNI